MGKKTIVGETNGRKTIVYSSLPEPLFSTAVFGEASTRRLTTAKEVK